MWFKPKTRIGIYSNKKNSTSISISMVKGEPYYEPHSKHSPDDYYGILPKKRMLQYKVMGTNPKTNRRKTVRGIIVASWKEKPSSIKEIEPPYDFILDMRPATERQLALLSRYRIHVPADISLEDASVVISHLVSDTESSPCRYFEPPLPDEIMEQAAEKGLLLPSFLSLQEAKLFLAGKVWRRDLR